MLKILKALWKRFINFLFNSSEAKMPPYKEDEALLNQIQQAQAKLDRAWSNMMNAQPEYIEIAILEVHMAETEYSILNKKFRMVMGQQQELANLTERVTASGRSLPWLERNEG